MHSGHGDIRSKVGSEDLVGLMILWFYDSMVTEAPASTCPVVLPWPSTWDHFPPGPLHNWNLPPVMVKITVSLPSSALLHSHLSPHSSWIVTIVGRLQPARGCAEQNPSASHHPWPEWEGIFRGLWIKQGKLEEGEKNRLRKSFQI